MLGGLGKVAVWATVIATQITTSSGSLVPFTYDAIPLGSISPNGWLRAEMETEAAGLAGHLADFYMFVADSSWLNGTEEYSGLNEAWPYWLNGMVPLAYGLNDQTLKDQVHYAVDYVLEHTIAADGWIGPETGEYRLLWARTLVLMGFTNLVEANSTYREPLVKAMIKFNDLMNSMLKDDGTGIIHHKGDVLDKGYYFWFRSRTQDMILSLQWLYDNYPSGKEDVLLENMKMLHHYGYKWEDYFVWGTYLWQNLYNLPGKDTNEYFQFLHGVNVGEGLKAAAVIRRYTQNDSLIDTAKNGVKWTFKYHGAASGTVLADEREDGLDPFYGSETCIAVEVIFSQAYNYMALGDSFFGDGAELTAFNALPGALTGDWWAHVYVSQPNQPFSKNLSQTPFFDVNSWGQTFGLEPNYPCCTVNHPQGLPKFLMYSYLKVKTSGILHALLSPAKVTTTANGGAVVIDCTTDYPFGDVLDYTIDAEKPFDFYTRVPDWANGSTLTSGSISSTYNSEKGLHKISLPQGKSTVMYTINTPDVRLTPRANDTVAVYRGQLLFALEIGAHITSTIPRNYYNESFYSPDYAPPQSRDYTMTNTTEWAVAIDPTTIKYFAGKSTSTTEPLPSPIFAPGAPPMYMTAKACAIDWPLFDGSVPGPAPALEDRVCRGATFDAKLVPYGSAKLRMAEIPTISLS